MGKSLLTMTTILLLTGTQHSLAADQYALDAPHAAVTFKISHIGLSWTYGRFNEVSGEFTFDKEDASKSAFALSIKAESLDTNIKKRDDHLRSPDFFSAKEFPVITFKSTSVKAIEGGLEVSGNLTLHGVTKSLVIPLKGGRTAEFPKGTMRMGYSAEFGIKRTEFGMDKMVGPIGDDVYIAISFEGVKK